MYESYRLPKSYNVKSLQDNEIISGKNIKLSTTLNRLPPLIKGYLRAGGMVSENFYIDKEFETIKQKLDNPNFLIKAPKAIVEKEELKKQRLEEVIKNLEHKKSLISKI